MRSDGRELENSGGKYHAESELNISLIWQDSVVVHSKHFLARFQERGGFHQGFTMPTHAVLTWGTHKAPKEVINSPDPCPVKPLTTFSHAVRCKFARIKSVLHWLTQRMITKRELLRFLHKKYQWRYCCIWAILVGEKKGRLAFGDVIYS